ncbi:MAG: hypothetical protein V4617_05765 [Gemmatimonadota bacterium]
MTKPPYAGPAAPASRETDGLVAAHARAPYVPQPWRSRPEQARPESSERAFATAPMMPLAHSMDTQAATPVLGSEYSSAAEDGSAQDRSAQDRSAQATSAHDASAFYTPPFLDSLPPISEFLHSRELDAVDAAMDASVAGDTGAGVDPGEAEDAPYTAPAELRRPDDWPFSDAGAETTELSAEFRASSHEQLFADVPEPSPLPMWNDDDLMDIMPPPEAARPAEESPHWTLTAADASIEASLQGSNSESAARALETLAARVRSGELRVEGYAPELGDAAALAAALAALLGIRR